MTLDEVQQMVHEIKDLRKDRERLEWLIANMDGLLFRQKDSTPAIPKFTLDLRSDDWREVIDRAMESGGEHMQP